MKPKTLDEILKNYYETGYPFPSSFNGLNIEEAKAQIIELFKGCVPEDKDDSFNDEEAYGWNDCRYRTLKNMEKMR